MRNNSRVSRGIFSGIILFFVISCGHPEKQSSSGSSDSLESKIQEISIKISSSPNDPALYDKRATLYLASHQVDKAFNDINKAISIDPRKAAGYLTLSDIYIAMGKPDKSAESLKKAMEMEPGNNEALLRYARLNLIMKEYKTAFEYARKCLVTDQLNPRAWFILGLTHLETGDTVAAVTEFKKTVDQDQNHFEAFMQLGELYAMKKDNMAADYYHNALRVRPGDKIALYLLGMFYQDTKQYELAITTYKSLQKVDSSYRNAPFNIGFIYLVYLKDLPNAVDYFTKAIQTDPAYYEAFYNRGFACELMGETRKAYEDYQKTLKIHPNYDKAVEALNRLDKVRGEK